MRQWLRMRPFGRICAFGARNIQRSVTLCLLGAVMLPGELVAAGTGFAIDGCPATPNCVSSRRDAGGHFIRPLGFDGRVDAAWARLKRALQGEPRLSIVAEDPATYSLSAEAKSRVFGFVDDVSFKLLPDAGTVEVRSASRVGYWDFGVNRRRIERIRERFGAMD